jgi:DNA-binding NarL/FixJ family response regulator
MLLIEPVTVVLIDDHAIFRQALCRLISKDRRVRIVGVAENGEIGIEYARERSPAVVVTDLRMPGIRGVEVTRRIRESAPQSCVIVLTVCADHDDLLEALRAGARGYVLKSAVQEEIIPAILAAGRGESWLSPKIARSLVDEFTNLPDGAMREVLKEELHLTPRERMVLARLARGMTNRQIASSLGIAETTVKTHLQHILDKLDARNRLEAASLAFNLRLLDDAAGGASSSDAPR